MRTRLWVCFALAGAMAVGASASEILIEKPPDVGPFWNPLGNSGSYVYADSFIAPDDKTKVAELGMWLEPQGGGQHSVIAMQIWSEAAGGGPDWQDVIASTDDMSTDTVGLNLYKMPVTQQFGELTPGEQYWFVATGAGRGDPSLGSYRVGAHTQNSRYPDDGTFWFSNDPLGHDFDGRNYTPEMAFQVLLIPEPATAGLFGLALMALLRRRR